MGLGSKSSSTARKKAFSLLVALIFLVSIVNAPLVLAGQYDLTYDSAGNLVEGLDHEYVYDGFNQLRQVRDKETGRVIEEYWYGHEGSRIKKVHYGEDGTEETFYYIGNSFVRKINDTATTDTNYYYLGNELVAKKENGQLLFFHPDNLGSTSLITDESGNTVEKTAYLPFGEVDEGGTRETRLYTGKELDKTELAYYGARYYSPFVKQFIQPDTVLPDIYDPQQLNRYSYVRNNPYKYIDPEGNAIFLVPLLYAAAAFLIAEVFVPAVTTYWSSTSFVLFDNVQKKGVAKGTAVTAGELAVGGTAGAVVGHAAGRAVGWAMKKAGHALKSAFTSLEKMLASKTGSLNPRVPFESGSAKPLFSGATKKDALAFARGENLPEGVRSSANKFFQGATGKSDQFNVFKTDKGFKFEFFSQAKNQGYGKNYIQEVDDYGKTINEYKETVGPGGLMDRKYLTKNYGGSNEIVRFS